MPRKSNKNFKHINRFDWKKVKDWQYPYRDYGLYGAVVDPKYIKHREELFNLNGNGWWWGDGWWNGNHETPMERMKRYREEKGN